MAAGGLRRPPTKSPNRIPFGFRASHRVNNVFTRRFGSFAVGRASPLSSVLFGALLALHALHPPRVFPSGPFSFFSSSFASVRAPYAVGVLHVPWMSPAPDYEY